MTAADPTPLPLSPEVSPLVDVLLLQVSDDFAALRSRFPDDKFIVVQQLGAQSSYRLNRLVNELSQRAGSSFTEGEAISQRLGQHVARLIADYASPPRLRVVD